MQISVYRLVLTVFALLSLPACSISFGTSTATLSSNQGLRSVERFESLKIGSAIRAELLSQPAYAAIARDNFNSVTPENELKFKVVHPKRGHFDFSAAESISSFAGTTISLRCHPLIWHRQLPAWLTSREWSKKELEQVLVQHVSGLVEHFGSRCSSWDVVNEALNSDGSFRKNIWLKYIGESYISLAFKTAKERNPGSKLFYSDYDLAIPGKKQAGALQLLQNLKRNGVPLDGVGLQMHIRPAYQPSAEQLAASIRNFSALGIDVHISEMDVAISDPGNPAEVAKANRQYSMVLNECLKQASCKLFTVWGFSAKHSWIPKRFPQLSVISLFDSNYRETEAYKILKSQ